MLLNVRAGPALLHCARAYPNDLQYYGWRPRTIAAPRLFTVALTNYYFVPWRVDRSGRGSGGLRGRERLQLTALLLWTCRSVRRDPKLTRCFAKLTRVFSPQTQLTLVTRCTGRRHCSWNSKRFALPFRYIEQRSEITTYFIF